MLLSIPQVWHSSSQRPEYARTPDRQSSSTRSPPKRTVVRGSPSTPAEARGVPSGLAVTRAGMFIPRVVQSRYSAPAQVRPWGPHGPFGPHGSQQLLQVLQVLHPGFPPWGQQTPPTPGTVGAAVAPVDDGVDGMDSASPWTAGVRLVMCPCVGCGTTTFGISRGRSDGSPVQSTVLAVAWYGESGFTLLPTWPPG